MTGTTTAKDLAAQFYAAFERKTRDEANEFGDKLFYCLKDGSPDWMHDACREAHNGTFPNDWIYDCIHSTLSTLGEYEESDWEDSISEIADGNVDVYNNARAKWLASHHDFAAMVDEAVEELGHSDQGIYGDIGVGQYRLCESIATSLVQSLRDQAELIETSGPDEVEGE